MTLLEHLAAEKDKAAATDPKSVAAYHEALIDRLINKARGILPFNALVLALIAILQKADKISKLSFICGLSAILVAASSLILLYEIFLLDFRTAAHDQPLERESGITVSFIRKRLKVFHHSTFLSLMGFCCCCFAIAAPYFFHLFRNAYIYWIAF